MNTLRQGEVEKDDDSTPFVVGPVLNQEFLSHVAQRIDSSAEALQRITQKSANNYTKNIIKDIKSKALSFSDSLSNIRNDDIRLQELRKEMNVQFQKMRELHEKRGDSTVFSTSQSPPMNENNTGSYEHINMEETYEKIPRFQEVSANDLNEAVGFLDLLTSEAIQALDDITTQEIEMISSFALSASKFVVGMGATITHQTLKQCQLEEGGTTTTENSINCCRDCGQLLEDDDFENERVELLPDDYSEDEASESKEQSFTSNISSTLTRFIGNKKTSDEALAETDDDARSLNRYCLYCTTKRIKEMEDKERNTRWRGTTMRSFGNQLITQTHQWWARGPPVLSTCVLLCGTPGCILGLLPSWLCLWMFEMIFPRAFHVVLDMAYSALQFLSIIRLFIWSNIRVIGRTGGLYWGWLTPSKNE